MSHTLYFCCGISNWNHKKSYGGHITHTQIHIQDKIIPTNKKEKIYRRMGLKIKWNTWIVFHLTIKRQGNLRGMVTLKCWGSEINSFLLSSFKPIPVGPRQTQKYIMKMTKSYRIYHHVYSKRDNCYAKSLTLCRKPLPIYRMQLFTILFSFEIPKGHRNNKVVVELLFFDVCASVSLSCVL